jgi:hypothetical protein
MITFRGIWALRVRRTILRSRNFENGRNATS